VYRLDFYYEKCDFLLMAALIQQMLTANRLRDGDVVYWRAGGWVEALGQGDVFFAQDEAEAALEAARKFVADNVVVNPYLFDVRAEADGVHPVKEREIVRAAGPTVREDLGKQAITPTEKSAPRIFPPPPQPAFAIASAGLATSPAKPRRSRTQRGRQ
jgi:hypothetical protein